MSKAAQLADELTSLTAQIDKLEAGAPITLNMGHPSSRDRHKFHPRAAPQIHEHAVAILKAARAELLVEVAQEVGLPARFEEAAQAAVIVQHPTAPDAPALPESEEDPGGE